MGESSNRFLIFPVDNSDIIFTSQRIQAFMVGCVETQESLVESQQNMKENLPEKYFIE